MSGPATPDTAAIAAFFAAAKKANPDAVRGDAYRIRAIGSSQDTMTKILAHVRNGEKRGTFSLPWLLEKTPELTPKLGEYVVLVDFDGQPGALVTTTEIENITYDTITAAHTAVDGPAIRELTKWQAIHKPYWTQALAAIGEQFAGDMPVLVEHFKLVYPQTDPNTLKQVRFETLQRNALRPSDAALDSFWRAVKIARPDLALPDNIDVRCIGITQPISEIIFEHVASHLKTATFRPVSLFKPTGQQPVKVGDCTVLVQYDGTPRMALRYTHVETLPFRDMPEKFTLLNGPPINAGDTWHGLHRGIYANLVAATGLTFSDDEPVLVEVFELIYPQPLDTPVPTALQTDIKT